MTSTDNELLPPNGYYRTAEEWSSFRQSRGNPIEEGLMELYSEHRSEFIWPKGLDKTMPREFHQRIHSSASVVAIPEGRLWGPKGAVITPENKLLWDVSLEYWGNPPEQHSVFHQASLPPIQHYSETLGVLTYTASEFYFHWIMDVLPRIDLLRKTGIAIDKFVINTNANSPLPFQDETLNILGIPPSARIEINGNVHLKGKTLLVPSLVGNKSHYPKWAIDFLKKEFSTHTQVEHTNEYERIYISRDDAYYRKVVNEQQIMNLLDKYCFKKVTLSDYSVMEQIRIFASADIIISPHGSNLTNLLFCKPGTKVIEMFSPYYVNAIYWVISNHAELDYYYLICNKRPKSKSLFDIDIGDEWSREQQNIEVNIDRLSKIMEIAGAINF